MNGFSGFFISGATTTSIPSTSPLPQAVTAWPNPMDNTLYITNTQTTQNKAHLIITDALGRKMTQLTPAAFQKLDVESWPAGIYFLTAPGHSTLRLIKK